MDLELLEAREKESESNLPWRGCRLFAQRGIASRLLSFWFDNFSQARRSYYLFFTTCSLLLVWVCAFIHGIGARVCAFIHASSERGMRFHPGKLAQITAICGNFTKMPQERLSAVEAPQTIRRRLKGRQGRVLRLGNGI